MILWEMEAAETQALLETPWGSEAQGEMPQLLHLPSLPLDKAGGEPADRGGRGAGEGPGLGLRSTGPERSP